jgi:hypothetical protein
VQRFRAELELVISNPVFPKKGDRQIASEILEIANSKTSGIGV